MRIGIGIDTGGTYTDAVIYDFDQKEILHSAKSLTTRDNLSKGIGGALDGLSKDLLKQAELVSLSTTLATNACVEEKGGRGKLIFIGADREVVDRTGKLYGLPDSREIFFVEGEVSLSGEIVKEPDWDKFVKDCKEQLKDVDAVAVVQQAGVWNHECETKAKVLIEKNYGLNTICGHELFSDLNYIKRGASALLNARLIPVIAEFLESIKYALEARGISAPVVIVRGDGSLMSERFTTVRPVETLLSGPAASVKGGVELTLEQDCLIIDMGGTTTDLAIIQDGIPVKAENGVAVGKWRTFVKAVYIDTFGLGGDSAIRYNRFGTPIELLSARVVPLCIAAATWPIVTDKLELLVKSGISSSNDAGDFFYLVKEPTNPSYYTEMEMALCQALKTEPRIPSELAAELQIKPYQLPLERLEKEGIIMRCGLTPTDIMHVKGDFDRFDRKASRLGVEYAAKYLRITADQLADLVYEKVKFTLYANILRISLAHTYPDFKSKGVPVEFDRLIRKNWDAAKTSMNKNLLNVDFSIPYTLVGIGAPIHVFLPDVAKALHTHYVIPENASVANALGAVVGNISATTVVEIHQEQDQPYIVFGKSRNYYTMDMDEALELAKTEAREVARIEALNRGAVGDIIVTLDIEGAAFPSKSLDSVVTIKVKATANGRILI
ncbi:N-methylhydantoinase A/acetone carboxylase, beta subunit [Desulfitobacterium dichloroeliminans LMG P-21439]|uniref:N-methylhydantoinase A/acetone carboxylase, beta subunit n=1 Tax=Desulfitobacterium dichloroeliminans (strain LMG P-21439 / DCA1) TaxID=871963 RepID=L0F9U1_DESDL|nr:hydantoinase/oxoprolinase family protein [Desulfitobacterium dichloroeliminans]AGA69972.1 N-methylhydantoinase A/acetone carboxylase, beta subunit [Desulfitobacterium dichloroeliminans LMG P-21439]